MRKPYKRETNPSKILFRIKQSKYWLKIFNETIISNEIEKELLRCISVFGTPYKTDIQHLINLAKFADISEIFENYSIIKNDYRIDRNCNLEWIKIKYGKKEGERRYLESRENAKKTHVTMRKPKYWIDRGYSLEEAKIQISKNSAKGGLSRTKESYVNWSKKLKYSVDYWIDRGYSLEEAEELRKPYVLKCSQSLDVLIEKYGLVGGIEKYRNAIIKRKNTMLERYGTTAPFSNIHRASKESLKVFLPVIDYLNQLNINDYYIGYEDKKEWFVTRGKSNKIYCYDFYIPEINLIIEYNGLQWHYRDEESWDKFSVLKDKKEKTILYDSDKMSTALNKGFNLLILWNDKTIKENISVCQEEIRKYKC